MSFHFASAGRRTAASLLLLPITTSGADRVTPATARGDGGGAGGVFICEVYGGATTVGIPDSVQVERRKLGSAKFLIRRAARREKADSPNRQANSLADEWKLSRQFACPSFMPSCFPNSSCPLPR